MLVYNFSGAGIFDRREREPPPNGPVQPASVQVFGVKEF